jgi:dTDP-4-amino-4,6-dideoxygalactose transaminase
VMRGLRERGIGTQVHYLPVHRQPYYRRRYGALSLPGADAYYAQALTLPLFPQMGDEDVRRVADALADLVECRPARLRASGSSPVAGGADCT